MLLPNVIFRCNGAAMLLSNKHKEARWVSMRLWWWPGGGVGGGGGATPCCPRALPIKPTTPTNLKTNRRAKYELEHLVRVNLAGQDRAYRCVYQMEDDNGERVILLRTLDFAWCMLSVVTRSRVHTH
jgi:hypothetical protein